MDIWERFDRYCDEHHITPDEAPMAFAAFLNLPTGWDGEAHEVSEEVTE